MELTDYSCSAFSEMLASDSAVPGGGSASAMTGAFGASLVAMVARLSIGRSRYAEYEESNREVLEIADYLSREFLTAAEADSIAYQKVTEAYKMPKKTDDEKNARKLAIEEMLKNATKTPFSVMELSLRALITAQKAVGKTNLNAASDLGTAALCLRTALEGAWLNVRINLGSVSDKSFVDSYEKRGLRILEEALSLADDIYNSVLKGLAVHS